MSEKSFDISTFRRAQEALVAKNDQSWDYFRNNPKDRPLRDYSPEEIEAIINSSSLESQQRLSRNYYDKNGFYKRIILYYATLLTYSGLLIPNPSIGKKLSTQHISKRYFQALEYFDKINLKEIMTRMSLRALIDGSYYGIIQSLTKDEFVLFDLPSGYCTSRYRDIYGHDIVEFDVRYFNSITDPNMKEEALRTYPKIVSQHYTKWSKGRVTNSWVKLPSDLGICFTFFDDGRPLFLNVIPATIKYDDAVETERERELEEIRKIIVQKVPHLSDGSFLLEPDEVVELHSGAVGMMKGNRNVSVLTTYADVDSISSHTTSEQSSKAIEHMAQNLFAQAGASQQIFATTSTASLKTSIENDVALMMILGNKYSFFFTHIANVLFGNANISFSYNIQPITYYNRSDFITDSLKLAQTGYSFLVPALATGISQRELMGLKELENEVLKLNQVLIPLQSSFTQSNDVGAPEKDIEDQAEKTIINRESIDNQGGSE